MSSYAKGTSVTPMRSRLEIEHLLERFKAERVAVGFEPRRAVVQFSMKDRHVRFAMPLPHEQDYVKHKDRRGWILGLASREKLAAQETKERWRALALTIKAKLVSVENGVETFEQAFLAHIVMPGGATLGEMTLPAVEQAYLTGRVDSPLLLGSGE